MCIIVFKKIYVIIQISGYGGIGRHAMLRSLS